MKGLGGVERNDIATYLIEVGEEGMYLLLENNKIRGGGGYESKFVNVQKLSEW